MVYAHLAPFDATRDFETLTFFRAFGVAYERGVPFPGKDEQGEPRVVGQPLMKLLYNNRKIGYAKASQEEGDAVLAPATIADLGGGWYEVKVPWIDEPEKVRGRDPAVLLATELRDAGEPDDHHGVAVVEGENGWYKVNAAWLDQPESVQGADAAYERATALRKEGPPAGWTDPASLAGSDEFEASYQIDGAEVSLGDIVAAAQAASGHDPKVWNALDQDTRDGLIRAELDRRLASPGDNADGGADGDDQAAATGGTGSDDTPPTAEQRVQTLVDAKERKELVAMIEEINGARAVADPPLDPIEFKSDHNKTDLAKLIVEVDGDLAPDEGGGGGAA